MFNAEIEIFSQVIFVIHGLDQTYEASELVEGWGDGSPRIQMEVKIINFQKLFCKKRSF